MEQLTGLTHQPVVCETRPNRPRFGVHRLKPVLRLFESWVLVFAAAFGLALGLVWVVVALALFLMRPLP